MWYCLFCCHLQRGGNLKSVCITLLCGLSRKATEEYFHVVLFIMFLVRFLGPVHTNPFSNENSVFIKICVDTYRFRIVFARPHYNAVSVLKTFYILSAHAQINSTHAHFNLSAREIGAKLKPHGSVCPPFWILTVEWSVAWSCLF